MGCYFAVIVLITNEYRHRHHTIALETENLKLNQKYLKYMLAFSPLIFICILSLSLLVLAWKALKLLDEKYNFHQVARKKLWLHFLTAMATL